ncbi:hypothetical protein BJ165DRAFT_971028 [Panaeolus papilionaceus]|nr:hypothetical protein BJ165DRAFT_971028 [Panaeolus papilionaceus]
MSVPESFMPDSNDFDLPRWQTHVEPIPQQQQQSYLYNPNQPPPPPPPPPQSTTQRVHSVHQTPSRQPRISQLLEQDQQLSSSLSPYSAANQSQLSRSASLGATAAGNLSARIRRQHPQTDDIEGAFSTENSVLAGPRQQPQLAHNSYYSPTTYQPQSMSTNPQSTPAVNTTSDAYSELYYNGSLSQPPKRLQPGHDASNPATAVSRGSRSPLRMPNTPMSASPLDQYSHQTPYSPTTAPNYSYSGTVDQRSHPNYQSHSRSQSTAKTEPMTPPPLSSSYPSQPSNLPSSNYSTNAYSNAYAMDTSSPHPSIQSHLAAQALSVKTSHSNPSTPLSYMHPSSNQNQHYYPQDQAMAVDPPKRRAPGFRRVRHSSELTPKPDLPPTGRRMGADGQYLSPLRQLTTNILDTYRICNPQFRYESAHNPRRVLTKPSKPAHNDGYDNDDYDYILYVNDWLGSDDGHKYLILDILGQGTFGQVVKCQNMKTHEIVAVKVVKNKPAYFNQSMMEVTILELLNKSCDPNDEHHILRLRDSFIHRSHLCLVFELLSSNLYELIKQNQFQGLSTQLVKVFMAQLLDALTVLKEARLIHCDLKPENILLKSLQSPQIKVIDFGSACHERQTVYTYIQSRFYRSPEVLLGMSYTASIDMWSLGCIAVELFLGLPLFPGTSEYNQLTRIVEMLGLPPLSMFNTGKQTSQFFDSYEVWNPQTGAHEKKYRLKSIEQYSREHNTNEQPGKQYFKATSLPEIINTAPMPAKTSRQGHELEKELNNRAAFIDFCQGLLNLNPVTRWTPQQARLHPFITGEKFTKPFVPEGLAVASHPSPASDPKRPYGGLVPSQPKGTRAYTDAASYNHHLAQHQAYTTAQAQSQAAANTFRNPYITPPTSQHAPSAYPSPNEYQGQPAQQAVTSAQPPPPQTAPQQAQYLSNAPPAGHRGLTHQNSTGNSGIGAGHLSSNIQSNPYIPNQRGRANTVNHQMDSVPPALARLQHMNQDIIGGRNALTPVLNRDDAMKEWERRQTGKQPPAAQPYQPLEFLQQQAEMATSGGLSGWGGPHQRYPPPPSKLSQAYQPQLMVDEESGSSARRDAVLSNVRSAPRTDGSAGGAAVGGMYGASNVISSPPQVYTSNATTTGNRYATGGYPQQQSVTQHQPSNNFDSLERSNMYVPMQPEQYQSYPGSNAATRHVAAPAQAVPPSFYGASVIPSGQLNQPANQQQRNPFQMGDGNQQLSGGKNVQRGNSGAIETWPR